jgi:hypothetical protein
MNLPNFKDEKKSAIRKLLKVIGNDGHSIWTAKVFREVGMGRFVKRFERVFKSSKTDPKHAIFKDGKLLKELKGIYGYDVLFGICTDLGLKYEDKMGRGFQARCWTDSIEKWLKKV